MPTQLLLDSEMHCHVACGTSLKKKERKKKRRFVSLFWYLNTHSLLIQEQYINSRRSFCNRHVCLIKSSWQWGSAKSDDAEWRERRVSAEEGECHVNSRYHESSKCPPTLGFQTCSGQPLLLLLLISLYL